MLTRMRSSRETYLTERRQQQPVAELQRKAEKARTRSNLYTQEELDLACAEARELVEALRLE